MITSTFKNVSHILITGGAGYIGSHMLLALKKLNVNITVLDNLSTGHESNLITGNFIFGDIRDEQCLERLFNKTPFDAVIHFGASTSVPESILNPAHYFENNTVATLNLLKACLRHRTKYLMFSSTAAVYGNSREGMVTEETTPCPLNPYGHSKWLAEQIIQSCAQAHGMHTMILRYFNVAGVDPSYQIGPRSSKTPHLLKAIIDTALGRQKSVAIFGNYFPTPDGTGIRDYIHVNDLIEAHILALKYLINHNKSMVLNCGYGHGFSVNEVIEASRHILKVPIATHITSPRAGDCPKMIANPMLLKKTLGWKPQWDDLATIIKTQWDWELALHKQNQFTMTE